MPGLPRDATLPRFEALAFRAVPLLVLCGLAIAGLAAGPAWSAAAAPWPWIVSLAFVGLPHGAADLAVTRRAGRGPAAVATMFAAYVAVMSLAGGAFALAPVPALLAFVALSCWHFGSAHAAGQAPPASRRNGGLALAALGRGGPVVGVPLVVWPAASAAAAVEVARLAGTTTVLVPAAVRCTGAALLAVALVALALEARASRDEPGGRGRVRETLVEMAVIGLLGATTAPLFAVGCYFLVWHAWRQMRLLAAALDCGPVDGPRTLAAALGRIHAAALPLLVPTWMALAAAWWWLPEGNLSRDPRGLAILSLAVYVVVTPSHDLLVEWWQRRPARVSASNAPVAAAPRGRDGALAG